MKSFSKSKISLMTLSKFRGPLIPATSFLAHTTSCMMFFLTHNHVFSYIVSIKYQDSYLSPVHELRLIE